MYDANAIFTLNILIFCPFIIELSFEAIPMFDFSIVTSNKLILLFSPTLIDLSPLLFKKTFDKLTSLTEKSMASLPEWTT